MIGNFFLFNACIEEELYYRHNDYQSSEGKHGRPSNSIASHVNYS